MGKTCFFFTFCLSQYRLHKSDMCRAGFHTGNLTVRKALKILTMLVTIYNQFTLSIF